MKTVTLAVAFLAIFTASTYAQLDTSGPRAAESTEVETEEEAMSEAELQQWRDSVNKTFQYQTGTVKLSHGVVIEVPKGFRYLDVPQSHRVLEELWGNPKMETMGMIFLDAFGPMDDVSWAFNISFDDMGYVKDEDADKIDYAELLQTMKDDEIEENKQRVAQGYSSLVTIGWASQPFYDKNTKTLHWALDLKSSSSDAHTLNYNLRVLGRKGVLSMNAIGGIDQLAEIKTHIPAIIHSAKFEEGFAYSDFNPDVDNVAAWTVGGLVAGKVLAKAGFFAILAKFGKFIIMGAIAGGVALFNWFRGRRKKEEEAAEAVAPAEPQAVGEGEGGEQKS